MFISISSPALYIKKNNNINENKSYFIREVFLLHSVYCYKAVEKNAIRKVTK